MTQNLPTTIAVFVVFFFASDVVCAAEQTLLSAEQSAAANYQKYCALCHGEKREGYINDHAPSLRSRSLMTSGERGILYATAYGRLGTPMAGYLDELGGPMTLDEIRDLTSWLRSQVRTEAYAFTFDSVAGNTQVGKRVYEENCASCHGENGQGGAGTARGNATMLSPTSDALLKFAVVNGRDGTEMPAFRETLSDDEINGVTAFLRSRSTGWTVEKPILRSPQLRTVMYSIPNRH